jgi:aminoglycoside phosphotransferase (APT) family kinase protein
MAGAEPPGPLVGSGRAADVYDIGAGRVLRRYRVPFDVQAEAAVMRHLHRAGFPVPEIYDADGGDLVMERLDGHDMLAELGRKPWLVRRHGRTLAALHNRLHEIQAPPGLAAASGSGDRVLHLDLHPGNVMLTSRGPVVIDWSNARAGPAGADVAMAYLIMVSSDTDLIPALLRPVVGRLRAALVRQFLAGARDDPKPYLASVARARAIDRNVRPAEAGRLLRIAERAEQPGLATREGPGKGRPG